MNSNHISILFLNNLLKVQDVFFSLAAINNNNNTNKMCCLLAMQHIEEETQSLFE